MFICGRCFSEWRCQAIVIYAGDGMADRSCGVAGVSGVWRLMKYLARRVAFNDRLSASEHREAKRSKAWRLFGFLVPVSVHWCNPGQMSEVVTGCR